MGRSMNSAGDHDAGNQRIQLALDAAGIGSFTYYPQDDRGEPDARLMTLLGLPPDAPMSLAVALATVIHPQERDDYARAVARALDPAGEGLLQEDIRVVLPDSACRWVSVTARTSFEGMPPRAVRMDGVVIDISARKDAEARLRAVARSQNFLVSLGDALRPIDDPAEVMRQAMHRLAEHLDVNRCYYGEVERNGVFCVVHHSFNRGVRSLDGRYRLDDYNPSKIGMLRTAQNFVLNDAESDEEITDEERDRYRALEIRSLINVPLVKNRRLIAVLGISDARPRQWSEDEIELVRETAERTWAAVERARAEAALRQSEERFQQVARTVDAVLYVIDAVENRVVYVNDAYCRLWKFDPTKLHRRRHAWFDHLHADDAERVRALFNAFLAGAEAFETEYRIVLDDGSERWVHDRATVASRNEDGSVRAITGMAADITQEKLAGQLLRQSEEKYRTLFESIDQGFCLFEMVYEDGRPVDYRFIEVNPAFERQTGLVDAAGRTIRELAPAHEQDWYDIYGEVERTGEPLRFVRRAEALDRDFDVYAFRVGPKHAPRVAALFADITDRRRMEEALLRADRRKDEFLATLAHELRNPLAPIRTGVELLRRTHGSADANAGADAGSIIGMMGTQVQHLVRMVDDLLDISRISRGKVELHRRCVDLVAEVRSAAEAMRATCEAGRRSLTVELPASRIMGHVDATRMMQVLGNLLSNAYKFTSEGGHIMLSLEREGDHAVIRVRDDGIGIADAHIEQIFATFMQVDTSIERKQTGLGLGLAVAKELVAMHGGSIQARSAGLGQGSEFIVRLPLDRHAAPLAPARTLPEVLPDVRGEHPAGPADLAAHARRRVLVVDDNRASADTLGLLLTLSGFDVRMAYEGRDAVRQANDWRPDAVVMDIGMPDLNGYEACRRMRADAGGRPMLLVALTGWGGAEDKAASRNAGFDLHLVKPVDPDGMAGLLSSQLASQAEAST